AGPSEPPLSEVQQAVDSLRIFRPTLPRTKRENMKSVLIVGLRGAQMEIVKAEFGARLDLRFHGADESKDALKAKAASADVTVGFTDFMSHSIEAVAQARSPNYIRSGGGMTSLRSTLENLCREEATA